jgi:hypothetical protein
MMNTMCRIAVAITALALTVFAQTQETFKTRISPISMDASMKVNIAGEGKVTAVLTGTKVAITGTFEGLKSNATFAKIHDGLATGVRGPAILDLTVTKAMIGNVTGSFTLTPPQIESLRKGRLYVQIHSEKAPEGNLWGWLLK